MKSPIRRREVSRLEALSDTVFGFSATLLVVSAILAGAGGLSIAVALSRIGIQFGLPGWAYALLGPACHLHHAISEKRSARRRAA